MSRRLFAGLFCALLGFALTFSIVGCSQSDLSGYRPAKEHAAELAKKTESHESTAATEQAATSDTDDVAPIGDDQYLTASALVPVNVVDGGNVRALMSIPAVDPKADESTNSRRTADQDGLKTSSETTPISKKIELLVKDKTFRTEAKTGSLRVSFDDFDLLKILNMEPVVENAVDYMPQWLTNLNGKTIKLRGYMFPTHDAEGIEQFVLARDNQICCFGRDPKIYDLVQITMKPGKTTNYIPAIRAFDVIGKFRIEMLSEGGKPYGLYFVDDAQVIDR